MPREKHRYFQAAVPTDGYAHFTRGGEVSLVSTIVATACEDFVLIRGHSKHTGKLLAGGFTISHDEMTELAKRWLECMAEPEATCVECHRMSHADSVNEAGLCNVCAWFKKEDKRVSQADD